MNAPMRHDLMDFSTFGGGAYFGCSCGHWYEHGHIKDDPEWFRQHWDEHVQTWRAAEAELDA